MATMRAMCHAPWSSFSQFTLDFHQIFNFNILSKTLGGQNGHPAVFLEAHLSNNDTKFSTFA
jgi:hypothetical protein